MKTLQYFLAWLVLCGTGSTAFSQRLSPEDAHQISASLRDHRMLSAKGCFLLDSLIDAGRHKKPYTPSGLFRMELTDVLDGYADRREEVSNASIIHWLSLAFRAEADYRMGLVELHRLTGDCTRLADRMDHDTFVKRMVHCDSMGIAAYPSFAGPRMEQQIEPEQEGMVMTGSTVNLSKMLHVYLDEEVPYGVIDSSRSIGGKTIFRTVDDLKGAGLIDDTLRSALRTLIQAGSLRTEVAVLDYVARQDAIRLGMEKARRSERQFAQELLAFGILDSGGYQRLQASYRPGELKKVWGILSYSAKVVSIRPSDFPEEPRVFLETALEFIRQRLLPELQWTDVQITAAGTGPPRNANLRLRFRADGREYSQVFWFPAWESAPAPHRWLLNRHLVATCNQWLAEQGAAQRLVIPPYPKINYAPADSILVMLVTPDQIARFPGNDDFFGFNYRPDSQLTREAKARILAAFENLGFFTQLSQREKAAGLREAAGADVQGVMEMLSCFPRTVVPGGGYIEPHGPLHRKVLAELAACSRGAFRPRNLRNSMVPIAPGRKAELVAFDFRGKHHQKEFTAASYDLPARMLKWLNGILSEAGIKGRWYYAEDRAFGSSRGYVFLTPRQVTEIAVKLPELELSLK